MNLKVLWIAIRDGQMVNVIVEIVSVSWKLHHGEPSPNYSSLGMNPNSITASELDNLIQDTINLIDVKL